VTTPSLDPTWRPPGWDAPTHRPRRFKIGLGLLVAVALGAVALLSLAALRGTLVLYRTPSQALGQHLFDRPLRVGGQIEKGSVHVVGQTTSFSITDGKTTLPVVYTGSLPGTFVPGQDALVGGELTPAPLFRANQLMVKHSDVYRAPDGKPYHPPKIGAGTGG
jgi:cytochrome c-type biogenesis protein CcmE